MKPILFNTPMSKATRDDWKTATRRLVRPQPKFLEGETGTPERCEDGNWCFKIDQYSCIYDFDLKPPYDPGDILYVRETWAPWSRVEGIMPDLHYKADGEVLPGVKWKPSIHMPKAAARTFLRVTDVRLERLQDITDEQCMNEGIQQWTKDGKLYKYAPADREGDYPVWPWQDTPRTPREAMAKLWDSTIKKEDLPTYGWDANPYVWVIEFEKISKEEAMK